MKKRKDGRYRISITENGKKTYFYGFSQREAQEKRDLYLSRDKTFYFDKVADEWFDQHESNIRYNTAESYIAPLKDCKAYFGETDIKEIKASDILKFLTSIKLKGYATQSIKLRHIVLNLIFDYAISKDIVDNNISRLVKCPTSKKAKREELSAEDIKKVVNSNCLLAKLLLYTGCRIGEAAALCFEDIDFQNERININKEVIWHGNNPHVEKMTKTDSGTRIIPLLFPLKEALEKIPNKQGYIFSKDGQPLKRSSLRGILENFSKEIGSNITAHQFRHSFSTSMFYAGVDVKSAAGIMGHSKTELMLNLYTHLRQKYHSIQLYFHQYFFALNVCKD